MLDFYISHTAMMILKLALQTKAENNAYNELEDRTCLNSKYTDLIEYTKNIPFVQL